MPAHGDNARSFRRHAFGKRVVRGQNRLAQPPGELANIFRAGSQIVVAEHDAVVSLRGHGSSQGLGLETALAVQTLERAQVSRIDQDELPARGTQGIEEGSLPRGPAVVLLGTPARGNFPGLIPSREHRQSRALGDDVTPQETNGKTEGHKGEDSQ